MGLLENQMDYAQLNALCSGGNSLRDGATDGVTDGTAGPAVSVSNAMLTKNLAALKLQSPRAAQAIEEVKPHAGARFIETDEGVLSVELDGVALASKRKPMHEARRFAQQLNPAEVACCAVVGFGMGYHCGTLLEALGSCGVVICFESDLGLLRAVLERVDYAEMFESRRFFLVTDPDDPSALSQIFEGIEAVIGLGVEILNHPPSIKRLGDAGAGFGHIFGDVLKATRTHVITTLANAQISFRNALMNLDYYASSAGIEVLKDVCKGVPAVVVSAGPSLERNIDLLKDPKVRDSVVVIAVQTVLKQMLKRGIKPDFVAALDYHEISKRFYEGLTEADVEGIRLVVETKANPAILDAFPGEVLCVADGTLDNLLGEDLTREMGKLPMGATVAHLCYYFARHLGCDPVIFIGQDLGFTDGQYYSAGAAIHQVWAGELNAHNTLEMMEWQRIVRMKGLLRKKMDIYGHSIYADEQMSTYLAQFEASFQKDALDGLTVIDATQGGVRKQHTKVMTLEEAIEQYGARQKINIPATTSPSMADEHSKAKVCQRVDSVIADCERIAYLSEQSIGILSSMRDCRGDQRKINKLIVEVQGIGERVMELSVAFGFVQAVNQVGVLNRMKEDRAIEMSTDASVLDRQELQIQRDITNVRWTRDAARSVVDQLRAAKAAFVGQAPKQANNLHEARENLSDPKLRADSADCVDRCVRVHAVVIADPEFGGLGTRRGLDASMGDGLTTLGLTLARLDRAKELDGITILTPDPDAIGSLVGSLSMRLPMRIAGVDRARFRQRASRVGSARVQSSECWRGSIGMLGVYDEQVEPGLLASVMHTHEIDACAIVGGDWAMIDPQLVDQTIERYRCQDVQKRIAFSQAVPGLGTMVIDRETVEALAQSYAKDGNHFATFGALVGYIPTVPQFDPIAKGVCVEVDPAMRDAGVRVIADSPERIETMRRAYQERSRACLPVDLGGVACVESFAQTHRRTGRLCPRTIVLETCTGRLASGNWGVWKRNSIEPIERPVLTLAQAHKLFVEARSLRDDIAMVFDGVGDPLMHPDAIGFAQLAKEDGIASVELRTDLLREGIDAKELLESGIDILSVDVLAEHRTTYASLTGMDRFDEMYVRIQTIFDELQSARRSGGLDQPWFVPRMTRCDAVYEEIEQFYDKWLMLCGSAVLDPLSEYVTDQRIGRLPIPRDRQEQLDRSTMYIQCDGAVVDRNGDPIGQINAFDEGIGQAYQKMLSAMRSTGDGAKVEPKLIGSVCSNESAA